MSWGLSCHHITLCASLPRTPVMAVQRYYVLHTRALSVRPQLQQGYTSCPQRGKRCIRTTPRTAVVGCRVLLPRVPPCLSDLGGNLGRRDHLSIISLLDLPRAGGWGGGWSARQHLSRAEAVARPLTLGWRVRTGLGARPGQARGSLAWPAGWPLATTCHRRRSCFAPLRQPRASPTCLWHEGLHLRAAELAACGLLGNGAEAVGAGPCGGWVGQTSGCVSGYVGGWVGR